MTAHAAGIYSDAAAGLLWDAPVAMIGGLPIAVIDRAQSAELMVDVALMHRGTAQRPLVITSANGQVLSMCARQPQVRDLFLESGYDPRRRHADGFCLAPASQGAAPRTRRNYRPVSRRRPARATKRCAHVPARRRQCGGQSSRAAAPETLYPDLNIVGHSGGYLRREGDEEHIIDAINRARPDILWLGLGAPAEQSFAVRHRDRLRGVGLIKTSGGLFDFLSGKNARAPGWMQNVGLEWAYRIYLEPRRLAGRYLMTNPHALFLLLTRTRHANKPAWNSEQR